MDESTRLYWEQIADRCFDRAYETALDAATSNSGYKDNQKDEDPSDNVTGLSTINQ